MRSAVPKAGEGGPAWGDVSLNLTSAALAPARSLVKQPLPPWEASRRITRKQSMSAFCVFQRPSHTLSREAGGCSSPSSSQSCWPPQGTARPLSVFQCLEVKVPWRSTGGRAETQCSEGAQNWPRASWLSYSLAPSFLAFLQSLSRAAASSALPLQILSQIH